MQSAIRNIRTVVKNGAFGNADAVGFWIYGKRRDGKTVPCKNEIRADGSIQIWSERSTKSLYLEVDMTEFNSDEWAKIRAETGYDQIRTGNRILDQR